jgi:hypothetical protein
MRKFRNRSDKSAHSEIHIEGNVATWFTTAGRKSVDHITERPVAAYIERLLADGCEEVRPCGRMRASANCPDDCELLDKVKRDKNGRTLCKIPSRERRVGWARTMEARRCPP